MKKQQLQQQTHTVFFPQFDLINVHKYIENENYTQKSTIVSISKTITLILQALLAQMKNLCKILR